MSTSNNVEKAAEKPKSGLKFYGMMPVHYLAFAVIVMVCAYLNKLPAGIAGVLALCIAIAALFGTIGNKIPFLEYFGGGSFLTLFGSSALVMFGIIPEDIVTAVGTVSTGGGGFFDFALAALIGGSLLGVDKNSLKSAIIRYLPCLLAVQVAAILSVTVVSFLIGYDFREAIMFVGLPVLGGGVAAGAIPMSQIVGEAWAQDSATLLSQMVPSIALANAFAIICGGFMNKLGVFKPKWTGNGTLIAKSKLEIKEVEREETTNNFGLLALGLFTVLALLCAGRIINYFIPSIHTYAWMIVVACAGKIAGVFPTYIEEGSYYWSQLFLKGCAGVLLVMLGISQIVLSDVIAAITFTRVALIASAVIGGCTAGMFVGKLIGFYPIEAGISAGLCSTDMGGSGDVAILGASNRMALMPYAAISTRIGGAMILILTSIVAKILF